MNAQAPDLLAAIVAATKRGVEVRAGKVSMAEVERRAAAVEPRAGVLSAALTRTDRLNVIAECKRRSPSKGVLREAYDPASHAAAYAGAGAAAISVLTEPTFFDGRLDDLRAVRGAVAVPLLRKDFVVSEYQLVEAVEAGADAVLLIVAALAGDELKTLVESAGRLGLAALVEVHDEAELRRAADAGASIVGVNSRNLRTLGVDVSVPDRLAAALPAGVTAVAESGIRSPADLARLGAAGYHACLVGERLIAQPDPGAALRELRRG